MRLSLKIALPLICLAWAQSAWSQDYPQRLVRLVVPQAAGGTTDVLARAISERLSQKWGQPVVVVNTVGAAGNVGTASVASAAPDGYTLLVTYEGSQAINPSLYATLPFDPVKDFQPVATLAQSGFFVVCDPKLPIRTFQDLLAFARSRTEPITYATSGVGSVNHLIGEMIKVQASLNMTHVPFRGVSDALTNIMGGHVQAGVASIPSVLSQVNSGDIRALAVSSARRSAVSPDVPTIAESGLAGFDVNPWWGILAPVGVDMSIVRKINADVAEILSRAEMQEFLAKQGAQAFVTQPEDFAALLKQNIATWAQAVAAAGLKPQ